MSFVSAICPSSTPRCSKSKKTASSFDLTITGGITLGLDFLNVKGHQVKKSNVLQWGTENNNSTSRFEILRSTNNRTFDVIKTILPSNKDISQYNYIDNEIDLGRKYFYIIKRVDEDGKDYSSKLITIRTTNNINNLDNVFSNSNNLSFDLNSVKETESKIQIYDMKGGVVIDKDVNVTNGVNNFNFNISNLDKGSYILFITTNEERLYQKFVK